MPPSPSGTTIALRHNTGGEGAAASSTSSHDDTAVDVVGQQESGPTVLLSTEKKSKKRKRDGAPLDGGEKATSESRQGKGKENASDTQASSSNGKAPETGAKPTGNGTPASKKPRQGCPTCGKFHTGACRMCAKCRKYHSAEKPCPRQPGFGPMIAQVAARPPQQQEATQPEAMGRNEVLQYLSDNITSTAGLQTLQALINMGGRAARWPAQQAAARDPRSTSPRPPANQAGGQQRPAQSTEYRPTNQQAATSSGSSQTATMKEIAIDGRGGGGGGKRDDREKRS